VYSAIPVPLVVSGVAQEGRGIGDAGAELAG
jgi:hypothetical protein